MSTTFRRVFGLLLALALAGGSVSIAAAAPGGKMIGVNVLLKGPVSDAILADLATHGTVRDVLPALKAVTVQARESELAAIRAEAYVAAANPDAERNAGPIDTVAAADFSGGINTWNLDAVNVTNRGQAGRTVDFDGSNVYVAVLDTGLVDNWRQYFPQERIATQYGIAFGGGGGEVGNVSQQPNKWEHDQNSHGTHVTSTIIGYSLNGTPVNGVAPKATIIPVKVLNQNGSGWSSVIARGITYIADLKASTFGSTPVVINMSLGGSTLDAIEKAAIDYAVSKGVIIVASAGNSGDAGMGYPGAYQPVISVAATGWRGQWTAAGWWNALDVPDPTNPADFFIADFSSRKKAGQDLDVAAPGDNVVGPYQLNGQTSYYYLSGTSMAAPHVAGIAALMAQKKPGLTQAQVETILEQTAIYMAPGSAQIIDGSAPATVTWGADATGSGLTTADAALKGTN